jgi:hypothetical protein
VEPLLVAIVACGIAVGRAEARGPIVDPAPSESRTADGVRFTVRCPAINGAMPLVIIAPNIDQKIDQPSIARRLERAVVVVVDPPREGQDYAARLQAVLEAMPSTKVGCEPTGPIAAWGQAWGGLAVLELARRREASGTPLSAVVAFLVSSTQAAIPQLATPTLIIDGARTSHPRTLVVLGATSCDQAFGGCTPRPKPVVDTSGAWRLGLMEARTREFFHAFLEGDAAARTVIDTWDLAPKPEFRREEPREKQPLGKLLSLSLITGWTGQGDGGFVIGGRPEFFLAWDDENFIGRGVGAYVEALGANGHLVAGAGVAYASYYGRIGLVPSIGYYHRTGEPMEPDRGIAAGVFLGFRRPEFLDGKDDPFGLDLPYGLRADMRFGFNGSREVMITAQLDAAPIIGGLVALIVLISHAGKRAH